MRTRLIIAIIICILLSSRVSTSQIKPNEKVKFKIGYLSLGYGWGFSALYSKEAMEFISNESYFIENGDVAGSLTFRAGFRNIIQYEYKRSADVAGHDIYEWEIVSLWDPNKNYKKDVLDMKYRYQDHIIKINTFLIRPANIAGGLFLMYGIGSASYVDKTNEGWSGNTVHYGIEYIFIYKAKYLKKLPRMLSFSLRRSSVNFDHIRLWGNNFPVKIKGSQYLFDMTMTISIAY